VLDAALALEAARRATRPAGAPVPSTRKRQRQRKRVCNAQQRRQRRQRAEDRKCKSACGNPGRGPRPAQRMLRFVLHALFHRSLASGARPQTAGLAPLVRPPQQTGGTVMGRVRVGPTVRQALRERGQQRRHGDQAGDARGGQRACQRVCRAASCRSARCTGVLERCGADARRPPAAWSHASRPQVAERRRLPLHSAAAGWTCAHSQAQLCGHDIRRSSRSLCTLRAWPMSASQAAAPRACPRRRPRPRAARPRGSGPAAAPAAPRRRRQTRAACAGRPPRRARTAMRAAASGSG